MSIKKEVLKFQLPLASSGPSQGDLLIYNENRSFSRIVFNTSEGYGELKSFVQSDRAHDGLKSFAECQVNYDTGEIKVLEPVDDPGW